MSAESEMRNVILHAAEKLAASVDATVACRQNHYASQPAYLHTPREAHAAMVYAEGVLRLLASYLAVEDAPRVHRHGERDEHGRFKPRDESAA